MTVIAPADAVPAARDPMSIPPVTISRIALRDFRNIARADLSPGAAGFALIGRNGEGKTNLLEAIYCAHALRSMRGARDVDLIRFGSETCHLSIDASAGAASRIGVGIDRATRKKRVSVDGVAVTRLVDAFGAVPSVVISPRDVALVNGAPPERRRYMDVLLATISRRYVVSLQRYRSALQQRNAALRAAAGRSQDPTVAAWEPEMAHHGAVITATRAAFVARSAAQVNALASAIGERDDVGMRLVSWAETSTAATAEESTLEGSLAESLARGRAADIRRGVTLNGPHREDLALTLAGRSARAFASAGQQRTIAIALRLLEHAALCESLQRSPVLLLDDPFAELDPERAASIRGLLSASSRSQVILAAPREDDVPSEFTALPRYLMIGGSIKT